MHFCSIGLKCSRNIERQVLPPTTPSTTLAKALKPPTRSRSVSHSPSGKKTAEGIGQGDQESKTQLETEGVETDRNKDSKTKWVIGGCVSVAFLAAVVVTIVILKLVRRLKQRRRKYQGDLIEHPPPEEDQVLVENTTPGGI